MAANKPFYALIIPQDAPEFPTPPPVDPGYGQGMPLPPHVGGGPIHTWPVDPGYGQGTPLPPHVWWGGGRPPHVSGGPMPDRPPHVSGGPMPGGWPVDPGYGQGTPLPPHVWGGGLPPHVSIGPIPIPPGDIPDKPIDPDKMVVFVLIPGYGYKLMVVPKPPGYVDASPPGPQTPEPKGDASISGAASGPGRKP